MTIPPGARVVHGSCPWCGSGGIHAVRPPATEDMTWWRRITRTVQTASVSSCCGRPVDFDVEVTRGIVLITYLRPGSTP